MLTRLIEKFWDKVGALVFCDGEPGLSNEKYVAKMLMHLEKIDTFKLEMENFKNQHKGPFKSSVEFFQIDFDLRDDIIVTYECVNCFKHKAIKP